MLITIYYITSVRLPTSDNLFRKCENRDQMM